LKVILDTNGLMIPVQFGVDIFDELSRLGFSEFLVPEAVVRELEMLVKRAKGFDKKAAKIGRALTKGCILIDGLGPADDVVLRLAEENGAAVLTNDIELKQRLKAKGISVLSLRQKNRLDFD